MKSFRDWDFEKRNLPKISKDVKREPGRGNILIFNFVHGGKVKLKTMRFIKKMNSGKTIVVINKISNYF